MIHDQVLQMYLWAKACGTVVYVQNRSPHRRLGDITPEEALTGEKPEISHLRIFGCPIYIHVPREKRMKLDPFGKQGIFVGYSELAKVYRIYIPDQRKMELSRDITFEEDVVIGVPDVQTVIVMICRSCWRLLLPHLRRRPWRMIL